MPFEFRLPEPFVEPVKNVTEPVGPVGPLPLTVAVKVTNWP
jgi:hypothetical protein